MKPSKHAATVVVLLVALAMMSVEAQYRWGGRFRRGYEIRDPELLREQQEMEKALNPEFARKSSPSRG